MVLLFLISEPFPMSEDIPSQKEQQAVVDRMAQCRRIYPKFNEFCARIEIKMHEQTVPNLQIFYFTLVYTFYETLYNMPETERNTLMDNIQHVGELWNAHTEQCFDYAKDMQG